MSVAASAALRTPIPRPVNLNALPVIVGSALLVLAGCASGFDGSGRFLDVAGGQVHVWCDGDRGPTVVFLSGIGGDDTLVPIAERISDDAVACFYHRPGDGDTERPSGPRTAAGDAADLHELLAAAEIETPAVLVGHSYGGLIALIAAAEHPEETAGIVLVDASEPGAEETMYAVMTDAQRAYFDGRLADFPYVDWPTSLDQGREAMLRFPDVPLTVITATRSFLDPCDPELPCEQLQPIWLDAQDRYAELTSGARHILADTSHYVHNDDPDLVEQEIRELLANLD
ncbi:MAG TPA: alpha/beta hydrolase [Candidatus Limnocylindrales bacterium]|nr:alpha/beta hydrolase [Candidatus Limnocylindrales bacterium]